MIYRRDRKRYRVGKTWKHFGFGFFVLVILFLLGNWWGGQVSWSTALARPFWFVGGRVGTGFQALVATMANKEILVAQNEVFQNRISDLELDLIKQELIMAENDRLRAALGLPKPSSQTLIAQVRSGPQQNSFDTMLVDTATGADLGGSSLAVGDLVGLKGTIALGRVIEVGPQVSKIKLFSAPGSRLPASLGADSIPVTLVGRGLGNFLAEIPRGVKVAVGDQVFFNNYSNNWLVAEVGVVDRVESETTQRVLLRTPTNPNQLSYVEIYH